MKRTSKSLLALLIAAMLCMVCIVGCTDKGTTGSGDVQNATVEPETDKTGETVTITFWIDNTTDAREATYQKLIDQFEDENPNIKVELLGVAGDMTQKLDTALAAGSPPDCSTLIQGSVSSLILNNKLVSLDSYLANWGVAPPMSASGRWPHIWKCLRIITPTRCPICSESAVGSMPR